MSSHVGVTYIYTRPLKPRYGEIAKELGLLEESYPGFIEVRFFMIFDAMGTFVRFG